MPLLKNVPSCFHVSMLITSSFLLCREGGPLFFAHSTFVCIAILFLAYSCAPRLPCALWPALIHALPIPSHVRRYPNVRFPLFFSCKNRGVSAIRTTNHKRTCSVPKIYDEAQHHHCKRRKVQPIRTVMLHGREHTTHMRGSRIHTKRKRPVLSSVPTETTSETTCRVRAHKSRSLKGTC